MNVALLCDRDAVEPPEDPVLEQVESALRDAGHAVRRLVAVDDVAAIVDGLRQDLPELVFNLAESFAGRSALESNVAGLLNLLGLRYTGSSPSGLLLAGDKTLAKKILAFHGIRSPQFANLYRGAVDWSGNIDFPLIVKPPHEDASLGITHKSVVYDLKALLDAMGDMHAEYRSPIMVEEFVDGREFHVGVLGNAAPEPLPPIELDFSQFPPDRPRIASWEAKWGGESGGAGGAYSAEWEGTNAVFPEDLPEDLVERMTRAAVDTFQALRLRDYARIDLRVTERGEVYVLEANPNCYLEWESEFARAAGRAGISHPELVQRIVELASARYAL